MNVVEQLAPRGAVAGRVAVELRGVRVGACGAGTTPRRRGTRSPSAARCSGTRGRARRARRRAARAPRRRPRADARPRSTSWWKPGSVISAVRMQPPSQSLRSSTTTCQPARASSAPHASELIPLPTRTTSGSAARAVRRRHRRSAPARFSSAENGQPSSATLDRGRERRLVDVGHATRTVSSEPTIWCPWPSTSSITIRQVDLEPLRAGDRARSARRRATS